MPGSSIYGKAITYLTLRLFNINHPITSFLDVGAGSGTYIDLLKPAFPNAEFIASEVFYPNVRKFNLTQRYSSVIVGDIRHIDLHNLPHFDAVLFGDVLEHMAPEEAADALRRCMLHCKLAVISIPIGLHPQGEHDENPFEQHIKEDWTIETIRTTFPDIADVFVDRYIGLALCGRTHSIRERLKNCAISALAVYEDENNDLYNIEDFNYPKLFSRLSTLELTEKLTA